LGAIWFAWRAGRAAGGCSLPLTLYAFSIFPVFCRRRNTGISGYQTFFCMTLNLAVRRVMLPSRTAISCSVVGRHFRRLRDVRGLIRRKGAALHPKTARACSGMRNAAAVCWRAQRLHALHGRFWHFSAVKTTNIVMRTGSGPCGFYYCAPAVCGIARIRMRCRYPLHHGGRSRAVRLYCHFARAFLAVRPPFAGRALKNGGRSDV